MADRWAKGARSRHILHVTLHHIARVLHASVALRDFKKLGQIRTGSYPFATPSCRIFRSKRQNIQRIALKVNYHPKMSFPSEPTAKKQRLQDPEIEEGEIVMTEHHIHHANDFGIHSSDPMQTGRVDLQSKSHFPRLDSLTCHFQEEGRIVSPVQLLNELVSSISGMTATKAKAPGAFAIRLTLNGKIWKEANISGSLATEAHAASQILEDIFAMLEQDNAVAFSLAAQGQRPSPPKETKPEALEATLQQPTANVVKDFQFPRAQIALSGGKSPVSLLNEMAAKSKFSLSFVEGGAGTSFTCMGTVVDLTTGSTVASTTNLSTVPSRTKKQAKAQAATELIEIILSNQEAEVRDEKDRNKNSILLQMQRSNKAKEEDLMECLKSLEMRMVFLSSVEGEDEEKQWGVPQLSATHGGGGVKVLSKIEGIEKGGALGPVLAEAESVAVAHRLAIKLCEFVMFQALDEIIAPDDVQVDQDCPPYPPS